MNEEADLVPADPANPITKLGAGKAPANALKIIDAWNFQARKVSSPLVFAMITVRRPNGLPTTYRMSLRRRNGQMAQLALGKSEDKDIKDAMAYLLKASGETVPFNEVASA